MEINFDMIPRATFCQPQIASFGYSEAQAKEKGYDVKVSSFPFSANGKARGMAEGVGFVKIVADAEHNEILGAHMIGPEVTELLPALTLAQQWDLTADLIATAEVMSELSGAAELGVNFLDADGDAATSIRVDLARVNARVKQLAADQSADIARRLARDGVTLVTGRGRLDGPGRVVARLA